MRDDRDVDLDAVLSTEALAELTIDNLLRLTRFLNPWPF